MGHKTWDKGHIPILFYKHFINVLSWWHYGFTTTKLMKIISKKSKVILFNKSYIWDAGSPDDRNLEVVSDMKLLCLIVSSDQRWVKNTQYIYQRDMERICDTYVKEIRSILKLAIPVWHSRLTLKLSGDIERIQKGALSIIWGESYM